MRALCSSVLVSLGVAAAVLPAHANPGDTQIIWGSYNDYLATTGGTTANLSADGRYAVFHSYVDILIPGQSPPGYFIWDSRTLYMDWISGGTGTPTVSDDGQTVAYRDDGEWSAGPGIFAGSTLVSVGLGGAAANGVCGEGPQVSGNARFVAFACSATNLVRGDTNGVADIFVRDRQAATTQRVNLGPGGAQANAASFLNSISPDARYVVFTTTASNLVAGDTNGVADVFLRDRRTGVTERISLRNGGGQANGASRRGFVSGDGRYVVFTSEATNVVVGDTNGVADVFVRDRVARTTERLSVNPSGVQGNRASDASGISADGRYVALVSAATNLISGDANPGADAFVLDRDTGRFELASVSTDGVQGKGNTTYASLSRNGHVIVLSTTAPLDVMDVAGGGPDLYVHQLAGAPKDPYTLMPGGIDFGRRALGSLTTRSFTLRNRGASALAIQQIFIKGVVYYEAFPMRTNCGNSLAAGASCRISITFQPRVASRQGVILVVGLDGGARVSRSVTGTGVNP